MAKKQSGLGKGLGALMQVVAELIVSRKLTVRDVERMAKSPAKAAKPRANS